MSHPTPALPWRVLKFGGTSLGAPDRLVQVIEIITRAHAQGPIAVVVSAMQHSTDRLIEAAVLAAAGDLPAAERIVDDVTDLATSNGLLVLQRLDERGLLGGARPAIVPLVRERLAPLRQLLYAISLLHEQTAQSLDLVLSFGERLSAGILSELLLATGLPALFVDARSWTLTDEQFGMASVDHEATSRLLAALAPSWEGRLPITTGFLGATANGRTTTLGRNGSDYTATLLARGLGACEVVIWTDVSGVMTADPKLVRDAYPLARLTYMEALEMVDFGASIFHPRTMIPLIEAGIPLRICNTMRPDDPGTVIDERGAQNPQSATSVTSIEDLALLGVQLRRIVTITRAKVSGRVFVALEKAGLTIWMSTLSAHGQAVAVIVRQADAERATRAIHEEFALELGRGDIEPVTSRAPVTLLTLVAEAMGQTVNVAGRFFQALGTLGIAIRASAQGASSRSISCVIDAEDTALAVNSVHATFNFSHQDVSLFILGKGTVGGQLLAQIATEGERLMREHDVRLKVVGLADSRHALFAEDGLDLETWPSALAAVSSATDLEPLLERLRRLPVPIVVDTTGADGMETLYTQCFARGLHVVAANKKPLTIASPLRNALFAATRQHHRVYAYSTTVGASLPVIETLKNLVRTGDHVTLIEGSFSGTIGYLVNEVMHGTALSLATRQARAEGYTEPNPQDDLSGTDVARKALILARELGLTLELSDVQVEPLIPAELLAPRSVDDFFAALLAYDDAMRERVDALRAKGQVLRYLARIIPGGDGKPPCVTVGPVALDLDHPATRLRGTEAFVAFTTARYREYPLIVQGSGAGGEVTAAGVLADILKVAMTLRGR